MTFLFGITAAGLALAVSTTAVIHGQDTAIVREPRCPTADCDPARLAHRTLAAARIAEVPPVIDGRLDEDVWSTVPAATGFVEARPRPAAAASLESEARVLVDDDALYVAISYADPHPDRIVAPLLRRDDEITSDWAFVEIDSRHDRRSGFSFGINPRGVQADGMWISDTEYDASWNAVWKGAAHINSTGWTAEFRIPLSQLPFSVPRGATEVVWGINFYRYSPSHGESSNWSPRYPGLAGVVSNFNDIRVPAPSHLRRVEAAPYIAARVDSDGARDAGSPVIAGGDIKLGLGSNFTLAATLRPDFGQLEADPSQVNLTAFELFQPERRPFFLEGLDIFRFDTSLAFSVSEVSFANESPFYSRRVGRAPRGSVPDVGVAGAVPATTTLLGAAKLSGRTNNGWTIGAFTASTGRERILLRPDTGATTSWTVAPLTTTTIGRAIRTLGNDGSSLGLFVSNVHATDVPAHLADRYLRDAWSIGADAQYRFADRRYEVRTWVLGSRISGDTAAVRAVMEAPQHYFQRPDRRPVFPPPRSRLAGFSTETRLSRVGGSFRWDVAARAASPGFDVSEAGYQRHADWLLVAGKWKYEWFLHGRVRTLTVGSSNIGAGWTWAGERRVQAVDGFAAINWRNYWNTTIAATRMISMRSTEWLHGGPAVRLPPRTRVSVALVSDSRQPSSLTVDVAGEREPATGSFSATLAPAIVHRASDRFQWSMGPTWRVDDVAWRYVDRLDTVPPTFIVGHLAQHTLSLTTRADLTMSPTLSVQFYVQPFVSLGRYDAYSRFQSGSERIRGQFVPFAAGEWTVDESTGRLRLDSAANASVRGEIDAPDFQQRILNGSVVLRWEYRAGSFLTLVWNQQRDAVSRDADGSAWRVMRLLRSDPARNVLMLKASVRLHL